MIGGLSAARTTRWVRRLLTCRWELSYKQTSRVWDLMNGETKMDFRGHEHVVECAVFAPVVAYPSIRELAGLGVSRVVSIN